MTALSNIDDSNTTVLHDDLLAALEFADDLVGLRPLELLHEDDGDAAQLPPSHHSACIADVVALDELSSLDIAVLAHLVESSASNENEHAHIQQPHQLLHLTQHIDNVRASTALALAQCSSAVAVAQPLPQPQPTAQPPSKQRATKWDPNKARNERREEIMHLRQQVAALEAQLAAAAHAATSSTTSTGTTRSPSFSIAQVQQSQPHAMTHVWADVATNQWTMRMQSERENIRLKFVLASQRKVAASLAKAIDRSMATAHEIDRVLAKQPHYNHRLHYPQRTPTTDASTAMTQSLLRGVDESYAELDALYQANGLAQRESAHLHAHKHYNSSFSSNRSSSTSSDTSGGAVLEVYATKVLPFAFDATVDVVWDHFVVAKERLPARFYSHRALQTVVHDMSKHVLIEHFQLEVHAKSTQAHFAVQQVTRRIDERDRVVIVWRAHIAPLAFDGDSAGGNTAPRAAGFLEKGYVVIKKPGGRDSQSSTTMAADCTLLQPCYVITPPLLNAANDDSASVSRQDVGALTDFVLVAAAANIRASHQMIEDLLLQQAMRGCVG